jgi:hypothetical protein
MIEIKFNINGRDMSSHNLKGAVEAAAMEDIKNQVQQELYHIRCSQHFRQPRVIISGSSLRQLKFSVEGCCRKLIDQATNALK